jgi:hypothetical protein
MAKLFKLIRCLVKYHRNQGIPFARHNFLDGEQLYLLNFDESEAHNFRVQIDDEMEYTKLSMPLEPLYHN